MELVCARAFKDCTSLERITIPLKIGLMQGDFVFDGCENLKHVHLVEKDKLRNCFDALLLEWKNDMTAELDSIEYTLSNAPANSLLQGKATV